MEKCKSQQVDEILLHITGIMKDVRPDLYLNISYMRENEQSIKRFSDWTQQRLGILTGEEYVYIRIETEDNLLYAINVTGNSVLTIAAETMDLLSRKF